MLEPDYILVILISSISSASVLLIATIGLAVIFGLMGVINLAHGEFIMVGAYTALVTTSAGVPFAVAIPLAAIATAAVGALVEITIIRRLYGRLFDTLLATWGLSLLLSQAAVLVFGTVTPGIGMSQANLEIGDYTLSLYLLSMIPLAAALVAAVHLLLTRTGYGLMARAAIQDSETASALGIESTRVNTLTFALGSGLAGLAGALLLPLVPATPTMGFAFVVKAFLTVVVAGQVTLTGMVAAGGVLGSLTNIAASVWTSVVGDIVFFTATIVLLKMFPMGISERWRIRL